MKIKTLAVIGLLALAPVHNTELSAASNTTVRVARDDNGKVDYKNFYQNGSRVKYENWDNGKKTVVINYKSRKVTSKTYYSNGVKTKYEKWSSGRVIQRTTYKNSKVTSKTYYSNGVKTKYEKWNNGRVIQRNAYVSGKVSSKSFYNASGRVAIENWSNGHLVSTKMWVSLDKLNYKFNVTTGKRVTSVRNNSGKLIYTETRIGNSNDANAKITCKKYSSSIKSSCEITGTSPLNSAYAYAESEYNEIKSI